MSWRSLGFSSQKDKIVFVVNILQALVTHQGCQDIQSWLFPNSGQDNH